MDIPEKILSFIRLKGPSIPVQVAKEISHNILMGSAYLAELTSRKQLKVSSVKIGGSPLYFLPGQEAHLQNFSNNLNEKDKRTYDLLKEKKILRESEQDAGDELHGITEYTHFIERAFELLYKCCWLTPKSL